MIGSRLLFSAYGGVGQSYRALQAGLLGQDALVVVDEAHLSPSFLQTLRSLHQQLRRKSLIKPFAVLSLSATPTTEEESIDSFSLEQDAPQDLTNQTSALRLNAEKKIEWNSFELADGLLKSKKAPELLREEQARQMASVAARYKDQPAAIVVFARTVDLVKKTYEQLVGQIDRSQILMMVGGMRGHERNQLVDNQIFKTFLPDFREQRQQATFLVATSCAEVGVDIDADYAVFDPTTADSFIQRLGRVNRLGRTSSIVTVIHDEELAFESEPVRTTMETIRGAANGDGFNATPLALRSLEFSESCYAPTPVCPPLDPARLDDWSMTSLGQDQFRRPQVSYWIRGLTENTTPETSLCWRADLNLVGTSSERIATVRTVRIKSVECARESTARATRAIRAIAEKFPNTEIVLISPGNEYVIHSLHTLAAMDNVKNGLFKTLSFATIVLPCEVGGLDEYGIVIESTAETRKVSDVVPKEWLRLILTEHADNVEAVDIVTGEPSNYAVDSIEEAIKKIAKETRRRCVRQIELDTGSTDEDDEEPRVRKVLAYFIDRLAVDGFLPNESEVADSEIASVGFTTEGRSERVGISLEKHSNDVGSYARTLAEKLDLSAEFVEALTIAGQWHDRGKNRRCWQAAVGNFDATKPIAKSNEPGFNHRLNDYYRHEFGSLIDADADDQLKTHPERDLILHLIASHHGYARPHFPERTFDKDNPKGLNRELAEAAMNRFARLQIKYGWWQLAYLEALLKAADAMASRDEARGAI